MTPQKTGFEFKVSLDIQTPAEDLKYVGLDTIVWMRKKTIYQDAANEGVLLGIPSLNM